jgi:hypothetical protein
VLAVIEITTIRMRELHAVAREMSFTHADIKEVVLERFGRHSLKDMTEEEAVEIILEWRREMRPTPPKQEKTPMRGFPKLMVARPAQNAPKTKPPELPAPLTAADIPDTVILGDPMSVSVVVDDADIDYLPDPDPVEEDAAIITKPLQPAVPRKPPLYVAPARPGTVPVRPPHGGGPAPKPPSTEPRPSFLKPLPDQGYPMPQVTTGFRMPLPPKPPEMPAPKPAAAVAETRQTGGFGRLRVSAPTATQAPPPPVRQPAESKAAPKPPRVWSDLKPDDIPF